jgi:CysZ protein
MSSAQLTLLCPAAISRSVGRRYDRNRLPSAGRREAASPSVVIGNRLAIVDRAQGSGAGQSAVGPSFQKRPQQVGPPPNVARAEPPGQPRRAPQPATPPPAGARTGSEFFTGMRLLGRGFGLFFRSPANLLLGMIPPVISLALFCVGLYLLIRYIGPVTGFLTWFANDWSEGSRAFARMLAGVAVVFGAVLVWVVSFTAVTLIIGDPFYEVISARVEKQLGGAPDEVNSPWRRTFFRNLADSLRLLALSLTVSAVLFVLGFLPVIGQTVIPVVAAVIGGWLLAVELTGIPFNRRGLRLAGRRRILRANRSLALGFGIPVFVMLLVPFAAIVVVPAAVAGSTLLTRKLLGHRYS